MPFDFSWKMLTFWLGFLCNSSVFIFITHFFYLRSHVGKYTRLEDQTTVKHEKVKFSFFPKFIRKFFLNFDTRVLTWLDKKYHDKHTQATKNDMQNLMTCAKKLIGFCEKNIKQMDEYLIENAPVITVGMQKDELTQNMMYMKNVEKFKLAIEEQEPIALINCFAQCLMLNQDKIIENNMAQELEMQAQAC